MIQKRIAPRHLACGKGIQFQGDAPDIFYCELQRAEFPALCAEYQPRNLHQRNLMKYRPEDVLAMARTLWGECRGEPLDGQVAVAWVIRNRAENPGWWSRQRDGIPDDTIEAVCLDRNQFSCWWDGQSSRVRTRTREQLGKLYQLAYDVLSDQYPDPTSGADHYHTVLRPDYAKKWPPDWAERQVGIRVGNHLFYRIGLN